MTGEMTPRQIDKEYCGAIGQCPDCERYLAATDLSSGGTIAAAIATAIANKDRRVKYRRGVYAGGTEELLSQMHFKHAAGYLQNGLAPCNCKSRNQLIHTEAVEAIAHQYRKDSPEGFKVDAECQFVKPGTPPEMYRPDIVVLNQFGGKHTCIEYQRSPEPFDKFVHRHELRGSEWGAVVWFFDDKIWNRKSTCEARDWLFDNGQTFYRCWVDEATLQLQVEEGTFATAVVKKAGEKRLRKFVPRKCSEADIINEYLLATGQETNGRQERQRERHEPPRADRLQGFNLVEQSESDRKKTRELFETLKRQKAEREEKERQYREWVTRQKLLADERRRREKLDAELKEQERLKNEAIDLIVEYLPFYDDEHELQDYDIQTLQSLKDDALAEKAKEEARRTKELIAKAEAAESERRAERERHAADLKAQWERENEERLERTRKQQQAERHWHPIKLSEPLRGGNRMVLNLLCGERIRPFPHATPETFVERTAAGYATNKCTHPDLEGWEVWKAEPL